MTAHPGAAPEDHPSGDGAATAVLLMAYGSPRAPDEVLPYFTHLRGGRAPAPAALAELERRYQAIGGSSPLQAITRAQAQGLEAELAARGLGWKVAVGMKHSPPLIEDAVRALAEDGPRSVVGLVLAPHFSAMSVGEYLVRARTAAELLPYPPQIRFVSDWHLAPGYISWLGARVDEVRQSLAAQDHLEPLVIFTAHSLPARLRQLGDPYPDQLGETARAVAAACGLDRWTTAWQSVAHTGEPWLGPELAAVVEQEAGAGTNAFLVCPCGFTADHLEILYDLDLEARQQAERLQVAWARTPMPNADPTFVKVLADLVQDAPEGGP